MPAGASVAKPQVVLHQACRPWIPDPTVFIIQCPRRSSGGSGIACRPSPAPLADGPPSGRPAIGLEASPRGPPSTRRPRDCAPPRGPAVL
eukprot:9434097-Pyramimonas_sp.AAC.1